jgi:hypothetical protein
VYHNACRIYSQSNKIGSKRHNLKAIEKNFFSRALKKGTPWTVNEFIGCSDKANSSERTLVTLLSMKRKYQRGQTSHKVGSRGSSVVEHRLAVLEIRGLNLGAGKRKCL